MPIPIACGCGRALRVPDAHVGRRVRCPGCGESHLVSAAQAAAADVPTAAGRPPRRRTAALLVLALLLAVGGWAAWHFWLRDRADGREDLALIPADAQAFVTVRLADLWSLPAVRQAIDDARRRDPSLQDPAAEMEKTFGLRPEEVERLSGVHCEFGSDLAWAVVRTVRPYNQARVKDRLRVGPEQSSQGGRYYVGTTADGMPLAVHFARENVVVFGPEEGVKRCVALAAAARGTGPLQPLIDLAGGRRTVVGGYVSRPRLQEQLKGDQRTAPLGDVQQASVFADVGQQRATLEVRLRTKDATTALALQKSIQAQVAQLQGMAMVLGMAPGETGKAAQTATEVLKSLQLSADGAELTATAQTDTVGAVAAVGVLLRTRGLPP